MILKKQFVNLYHKFIDGMIYRKRFAYQKSNDNNYSDRREECY